MDVCDTACAKAGGYGLYPITSNTATNSQRLLNAVGLMTLPSMGGAPSGAAVGVGTVLLDTTAAARAAELAAALGKTKDFVTIAVTETSQGYRLISSSEITLRPAVMALLRDGEVAVRGLGHAEVTGVNAARELGLTPVGVAASRAICPVCAQWLSDAGVATLSPLK
jgi:hypothetical protein